MNLAFVGAIGALALCYYIPLVSSSSSYVDGNLVIKSHAKKHVVKLLPVEGVNSSGNLLRNAVTYTTFYSPSLWVDNIAVDTIVRTTVYNCDTKGILVKELVLFDSELNVIKVEQVMREGSLNDPDLVQELSYVCAIDVVKPKLKKEA
jgi:hypothetical protein